MDSELAGLMPNNLHGGVRESPLDTNEIRNYIKGHQVLGERGNIPAENLHTMRKPRLSELPLRKGSGRVSQAKRFCIRIKRQGRPSIAVLDSHLDPEELKDALLQQAIAQRRALVAAALRPGTGRTIKRAPFNIVVTMPERPIAVDLFPVTSTQMATAKTPAILSQYPSPMEGIPERDGMYIAPRRLTPTGRTPVEGIPEFHDVYAGTRVGSNQQGHTSSPVEGLMHQRQQTGGFGLANMGVQTGTSLLGSEDRAVGAGDLAAPQPMMDDDDDDFGGFDDGGGFGGWGDDYDDGAAAMPPPPPPAARPRQPRRIVLNPGVRLRAQLPRKSLAENLKVGRQEVAPGIRRSTRNAQEPLKWWLGEKKEFGRVEHKTMPTIHTHTHKIPNTPWRTVADPRGWRKTEHGVEEKRRHKRKGAPGAASAARDDDDEEEDVESDAETEILPGGIAAMAMEREEEVQGVGLFGSEKSPTVQGADESHDGEVEADGWPSQSPSGAAAVVSPGPSGGGATAVVVVEDVDIIEVGLSPHVASPPADNTEEPEVEEMAEVAEGKPEAGEDAENEEINLAVSPAPIVQEAAASPEKVAVAAQEEGQIRATRVSLRRRNMS